MTYYRVNQNYADKMRRVSCKKYPYVKYDFSFIPFELYTEKELSRFTNIDLSKFDKIEVSKNNVWFSMGNIRFQNGYSHMGPDKDFK